MSIVYRYYIILIMSQAQAKLFKKCHRMLNRELDGVNIYI
jgi:hypothetical protein